MTRIQHPFPPQFFKQSGVMLRSSALAIWSMRPDIIKATFIPLQPQPQQIILYLSRIFHLGALRVKVFMTQNPCATLRLHRKIAQ